MIGDITFNHIKANNLFNIINECKRGIEGGGNVLDKELSEVSAQWIGESYDAFKSTFFPSGSLMPTFLKLTEEVAELSDLLTKVSDTKRDFEKNKATYFK